MRVALGQSRSEPETIINSKNIHRGVAQFVSKQKSHSVAFLHSDTPPSKESSKQSTIAPQDDYATGARCARSARAKPKQTAENKTK